MKEREIVTCCSNCGKEIPNEAKFCKYCGAKIEASETKSEDNNTQESLEESTVIIANEGEDVTVGKNTEKNRRNSKLPFIIGGAIATIIIAALIFSNMGPSVESITATYYGSNDIGTVIDNDSDIKVTATYDDGNEEEVKDGWSIDGGELDGGNNTYVVEYGGKETEITIACDLMNDGKYVASRSDIEDRFDSNAKENIDWYKGLVESDDEYADNIGDKKIDGIEGAEARVLFTKDDGSRIKDEENYEVPNSFTVTAVDAGANGDNYPKWVELGSVALCTLDSSTSYNQSKKIVNDFIGELLEQEGQFLNDSKKMSYEYDKDLEGLSIHGVLLLGEDDASLILHFNEL